MNDFDRKWKAAASVARRALRHDSRAPFGFAARVVARARETEPAVISWDLALPRLLAAAIVVLALCLALEAPHWRDNRPFEPGIENAVAQLVWSL
ncbi:MAG: hypothetical protein KF833_09725 [Verrucomicrobiae bacterium]|nr:hypothetical protein [Verrucomicrobiae bacterium]